MDLSKLHSLTNNYHDVRLISLREWKRAEEIFPRDNGGPYVVAQDAYDPQDYKMRPNEFVLSKSGHWMTMSIFFRLPQDTRRAEFVFGTAAEVVGTLESLPSKASILYTQEALEDARDDDDDLNAAVMQASEKPLQP